MYWFEVWHISLKLHVMVLNYAYGLEITCIKLKSCVSVLGYEDHIAFKRMCIVLKLCVIV